jgi:hypothetical protein
MGNRPAGGKRDSASSGPRHWVWKHPSPRRFCTSFGSKWFPHFGKFFTPPAWRFWNGGRRAILRQPWVGKKFLRNVAVPGILRRTTAGVSRKIKNAAGAKPALPEFAD